MLKKFGWLTPLALVALATAGCSGAVGEDENANNEETTIAPRWPEQTVGENATAPNENGNVGKAESQQLGWVGGCGLGACGLGFGAGYAIPGAGFGFGFPGAGYAFPGAGFVNPGIGYVNPGFYGTGLGWGRTWVW
jgi:hypothetical protein